MTAVAVPPSTLTLTCPVGAGDAFPFTVIVIASATPIVAVVVAGVSVVVVGFSVLATTVNVIVPVEVENTVSPE